MLASNKTRGFISSGSKRQQGPSQSLATSVLTKKGANFPVSQGLEFDYLTAAATLVTASHQILVIIISDTQ